MSARVRKVTVPFSDVWMMDGLDALEPSGDEESGIKVQVQVQVQKNSVLTGFRTGANQAAKRGREHPVTR